jgi:hypothetical protein
MTTSRERVRAALNHQESDKIPLDLNGTLVSGINVASVYKLRQALGLDEPGTPVKVIDPFQMLGAVELDLLDAIGADIVPLQSTRNFFGFHNQDWKPWTFRDTPTLVPGGFNTDAEPDGSVYQYPGGDKSVPPSGFMPAGGFYFDATHRQEPIDDSKLEVEDNLEEFGPITEEELAYFARESKRLYEETDRAIIANFGGTGFGDIALVPAPWLKNPKGIRGVEEWYMSTVLRRDYVYAVFERQCEIALENLARLYEVVGERVDAVFVTGTDFGAQNGPFISPQTYRDLYQPFHKAINDWVHANTGWKSFIHSCGSVWRLLDGFVEAGFDILNPVQTSAADMAPGALKEKYGDALVFWGGAVDTQKTLPFGTPEEVRAEVHERMTIFGAGGGFVCNPSHNIQAQVPVENIMAFYEAVRDYRSYPLS